jgi:hypothetical protein
MLPKSGTCMRLKVRLHYRAKSSLDEFARRVFDEFARRAKSSLKLGTLLDSINAPLVTPKTVVKEEAHARTRALYQG